MRSAIGVLFCLFSLFLSPLHAEEVSPTVTIMVPMRDGTILPTDIYLPREKNEKAPCILIRSPGGRHAKSARAYTYLTQFGYNVAIQDTRSTLDPEGKTLPYWTDGWGNQKDGYDAVEWLAHSPYSNGNIGTVGVSALGITQLLLAPTAPPSLKCQYISMAAASLYHNAIFPGGKLLKNQVEGWLGLFAKSPEIRHCVCCQPEYNNFWSHFDTPKVAGRVKVPGFHVGGWFDTFVQGTIDAFISRQEHGGEGAKGKQKLVIGPWSHFWPTTLKIGDFEVPEQGRTPPIDISPQRWFEAFLKEKNNGIENIPAVTYYVMGTFDGSPSSGNVWRHSNHWPIASWETPLYFSADHKLIESSSSPLEASFAFQSDANDPVPTIGGCNLFLETGPKDQNAIEKREDVLVFTSHTLQEDIEVTGRIFAKMFFSSDKPVSDIVIRLCDVYPDGRSILIADGGTQVNTSNKTDSDEPVIVDLWSTSIVFTKGHKIRVSISGSNYPRLEKRSNNHSANDIANNTLHVGGKKASHILLPITRKGDSWASHRNHQ